jgi:hypothetical protein
MATDASRRDDIAVILKAVAQADLPVDVREGVREALRMVELERRLSVEQPELIAWAMQRTMEALSCGPADASCFLRTFSRSLGEGPLEALAKPDGRTRVDRLLGSIEHGLPA